MDLGTSLTAPVSPISVTMCMAGTHPTCLLYFFAEIHSFFKIHVKGPRLQDALPDHLSEEGQQYPLPRTSSTLHYVVPSTILILCQRQGVSSGPTRHILQT